MSTAPIREPMFIGEKLRVIWASWFSSIPDFSSLPVYANNAAALAGGLKQGMVYKTATGELRIVV